MHVLSRAILIPGLFLTFLGAQSAQAGLIFSSSYENGEPFSEIYMESGNAQGIVRSTSERRYGSYSTRFLVTTNDTDAGGSKRSEAMPMYPEKQQKVERWYGLSIFLPDSYVIDPSGESLFQWRNDSGTTVDGYSTNNATLFMMTQNGRWVLNQKWQATMYSTDLGAYERGKWTDWVLHIKWSHQSDGLLEIWKNGALVLRKAGPNTYWTNGGNYFKYGIYKWDYKQNSTSTSSQRILYFDEMRVGDQYASYADVAPRGGAVAPAPAPSPSPTPTAAPSASPSPAPVPVSGNLVENPSFEDSTRGWELWENTSIVASQATDGSHSLRSGPGAGGLKQDLSARPEVGSTYRLSGSARLSSATDHAGLYIDCLNSSGVAIARRSVDITSTSYQSLQTTVVAPAGTARLSVWLWKDAGSGYVYLDNVSVTKVAAAPAPSPSPSPSPSPKPSPSPSPTPTSPHRVGVNIVANPGFESVASGWELWENTSVLHQMVAAGYYALRTGTGAGGAAQAVAGLPAVGSTYQLSASAMVSRSGDSGGLYIDCLNSSGATLARKSVTISSTAYRKVTTSVVVPKGTTKLKIWLWKESGRGYLYLDNVSLIRK